MLERPWDYALFAAISLIAMLVVRAWVRARHDGHAFGTWPWVVLAVVLAGGGAWVDRAGNLAAAQLHDALVGFAPTYAAELERAGHASVTLSTPQDDATYLALVSKQERWLAVNPTVHDIYTLRRTSDTHAAFVVDSETDYDGDGRIVGDRESRTAIGESYPITPALAAAFRGEDTFVSAPYTDRWGTWVSAYAPLLGPDGQVEAVLGVDFDAVAWVNAVRGARGAAMGVVAVFVLGLLGATTAVGTLEAALDARDRDAGVLAQARDDAEAANRAKSAFLANMSHEIRTPMTAVVGYADLLDDPELSAPQRRDYVRTIQRNANHLVAILNNILDLSKIEAGGMQIEVMETRLQRVLEDVLGAVRARADEKRLTLTLDIVDPVPAIIRTDPTRLRQILLALLDNAVKFTPAGRVRLVVHSAGAHAGDDLSLGSQRVCFVVEDTGIGMTTGQRAELFAPFMQVDPSTTRRFGGTGVGLSIARNFARLLGGDIEVWSEPGRGSTFVVTLPTLRIDDGRMLHAPERDSKVPGSGAYGPADDMLAGLRVLVAEDGRDNQMIVGRILELAGAKVTLADNGRAAVDLATEAQRDGSAFDVILMDMQMPDLDGYEATRVLRRDGYRRAIVALTAHAMPGDRERCLAAGCDDHVIKPFERGYLLRAVRHWSGRKRPDPPEPLPAQG